MMKVDLVTFLPDDVLVKVDRAAMAASLETRAPLLDHRVVEFALSLPDEMHFQNGTGKQVLRNLVYQYIPRDLMDRPKSGFGIPIGDWLRGPLRTWADDVLSTAQIQSDGLLNADLVQQTWAEHLSGKRNWTYKIWSLLMFQQWWHVTRTSNSATSLVAHL
jgi:asparagine synthase (glutamine-hydrolysing)